MNILYREAKVEDIPQIQIVRHTVKENVLSNPDLVTDQDCFNFLTLFGKGWVCEIENAVAGFSIVDLKNHNIWALFLRPEYEGLGIGRKLHDLMINWYFKQTREKVWLGTAPETRAEKFYLKAGWKCIELQKNGEVRFEMEYDTWKDLYTGTEDKISSI